MASMGSRRGRPRKDLTPLDRAKMQLTDDIVSSKMARRLMENRFSY